MTPATTTKRQLSTAEDRREAVIEAAMEVFGDRGFLGTATLPIAKAAGISQAYLFRLFPTKEALVLAVVQRSNERVYETFARAASKARAEGRDPGEAMGESYAELLSDRRLLLTQIHAHAAATSMPEVAAACRACFAGLVELVQRETGYGPQETQAFFALGMLMNTMAAIGATDEHGPWAEMLRVC